MADKWLLNWACMHGQGPTAQGGRSGSGTRGYVVYGGKVGAGVHPSCRRRRRACVSACATLSKSPRRDASIPLQNTNGGTRRCAVGLSRFHFHPSVKGSSRRNQSKAKAKQNQTSVLKLSFPFLSSPFLAPVSSSSYIFLSSASFAPLYNTPYVSQTPEHRSKDKAEQTPKPRGSSGFM